MFIDYGLPLAYGFYSADSLYKFILWLTEKWWNEWMCTLHIVICVLTAILANLQVSTSCSAIRYIFILLKDTAPVFFFFFKIIMILKKIFFNLVCEWWKLLAFTCKLGFPFRIGTPCTETDRSLKFLRTNVSGLLFITRWICLCTERSLPFHCSAKLLRACNTRLHSLKLINWCLSLHLPFHCRVAFQCLPSFSSIPMLAVPGCNPCLFHHHAFEIW